MTDIFSTPDDLGEIRASELHSSLGESLGAQAGEAFMGGVRTLARGSQYLGAQTGTDPLFAAGAAEAGPAGAAFYSDAMREQAAQPDVSIADAKARVKQEGLEQHIKLPEQDTIRGPVLDLMIEHAHERAKYDAAVSRGPVGSGALGFITQMGVGMIDPVNVAAFSIPVIGEARYGKMLAAAGESLLARAAVRGAAGAAQGAVGGAALVPADWWLHTLDGQDYTMADALKSVVLSAGMGGAFHAGGGAIADIAARRRGIPLEAGTHVTADALADEGVPLEQVPGIAASVSAPIDRPENGSAHPAAVLADLPPGVREDVTHAAIADVISDQPVRAAEMLQEAAKDDPRIAESVQPYIDAFHGSTHDFERFDSSKIGIGEGAQSYGHGLYFAENEAVSRGYMKAGDIHLPDAEFVAQEALQASHGNREAALEYLGNEVGAGEREEAAKLIKSGWEPPKGNLYKVRIDANHEDFLDWDKPLSEQPGMLGKILPLLPAEERARFERLAAIDTKGMDVDAPTLASVYRSLSETLGGPEKAAKALHEAGIPGIKYLDQGSRDRTMLAIRADAIKRSRERLRDEPNLDPELRRQMEASVAEYDAELRKPETHNYVVFDDALIRITHKNGEEVGLHELRRAHSLSSAAANEGVPGIDNSRDVVSGANSSKDPNGPVYIDRRIPQFSPKLKDGKGQPADLWKYLAVHEREEAAAMARARAAFKQEYGREPSATDEQRIYENVHTNIATPAERAAVEADGVDWKAYTHEIDGYLEHIEHEHAANPPPDTHVNPQAAIGHHRADNKGGNDVTVHVRPKAARGPRARDPDTWSLLEFIASRGGIDPGEKNIGDVRSLLGTANKFIPGFGNLIRKGGLKLDRLREAVVEAGYIHDDGDLSGGEAQTTVNTLLDAMDRELRGQRVYKRGQQPEMSKAEREHFEESSRAAEERFHDEIDRALEEVGVDPASVAGKLRERMVEIMRQEHVTDPLDAYERAAMEEDLGGTEAGELEPFAEKIPDWDEPDDSGSASGSGGAAPPQFGGQGPGAGGPPRQSGQADRASGRQNGVGRRADWNALAALRRSDDADLVEASNEAARAGDIASTEPAKAVSAAEAAAGEADKLLADILPKLSDDERQAFEDALNKLGADRDAREQIVRDGAACLAAASAGAVA